MRSHRSGAIAYEAFHFARRNRRLPDSDVGRCAGNSDDPSAASREPHVVHTHTELFVEWRPLVVGQATRFTAHLTRTGDQFRPYGEGKVTLALRSKAPP